MLKILTQLFVEKLTQLFIEKKLQLMKIWTQLFVEKKCLANGEMNN